MAYVDIPHVTSWSIDVGGSTHTYGSSDTGGFINRLDGIDDWTATIECLFIGTGATLAWGSANTLIFSEDGSIFWTGASIIDGITINMSPQDGAPITITYSVGGNGLLTDATGTASAPLSSVDGDVTWEVIS